MTDRAPLLPAEAAALLGVAEDAPPAEVQRAYLRAARRTHPDVLPEADDARRRAAAEAFDRLTRARDALIGRPERDDPEPGGVEPGRPEDLPVLRRERGLGGPLVVLALLGFLLIGLVAAEQALLGGAFPTP